MCARVCVCPYMCASGVQWSRMKGKTLRKYFPWTLNKEKKSLKKKPPSIFTPLMLYSLLCNPLCRWGNSSYLFVPDLQNWRHPEFKICSVSTVSNNRPGFPCDYWQTLFRPNSLGFHVITDKTLFRPNSFLKPKKKNTQTFFSLDSHQ